MHVVVVGAGIIGVCTAYYLRRAGFDVTVLERRAGVAQETSFANAGVLAPGYVGPWAAPGMPRKVLRYLFRRGGAGGVSAERRTLPYGAGSGAGMPSATPSAIGAIEPACNAWPFTARCSCTRSSSACA